MLEGGSHDSDSDSLPGTTQDKEHDILDLRRIKSIKLEKDLTILQHISHRQPHSNGRRYFGNNRPEFLSQDSSTAKTLQSSQRGRRKAGRPKTNHISLLTKPGPRWQLVKPPSENKHRGQNLACEISAQNQVAQKPRIWASTQSELCDIFPGISKSINGVSWESSETPFLMLEGPAWPEDNWSSSTIIELSMVRDFSCNKSDLESPLVNITPLEVFHRHYDDTHMNPPAVFFAKDGSSFQRATIVSRTDSTSACVLCRDCLFINSVEYHKDLAAMQLPIPSSIALANDNNRDSKICERGVATSKPSLEVPLRTQHRSIRTISRKDCEICGIDAGTLPPSTTGVFSAAIRMQVSAVPGQMQALPNVPLWSCRINATNQCGVPDQDGLDDELTLLYPSDMEEDMPSFLRYPLDIDYTMSNMRSSLPDAVSYRQLANGSPSVNDNWNSRSNQRFRDRCMPKSCPPEIRALIDAHTSGMPIAIISSRDSPLSPVVLPLEFGSSFLGFFFLTDVNAERIDLPTPGPSIIGQENGRILWKLRFHWTPGGEDFLPNGENLTTPWWAASLQPETSSAVLSTPYMDRKDLLRNCHSLLPPSVLSGQGPYAAGGLFPKGWYCVTCGKLNKKIFLRHRKCMSSVCQKLIAEKREDIVGYAERLEHSRDCMQTPILPYPADTVPQTVSSLLSTWKDGMHTYCYSINDHIMVKHVFTANLQSLQGEANVLFRDIQLHVELLRQPKGAGYFSHFVGAGSSKNSGTMAWQKAPSCLKQARDLMIHQGRTYGETEGCSVNQLSTLAWITTGRGKGPVIHARTGVVTVLCLGADAVLSLTPKSGFENQEICEPQALTLSTGAEMSIDSPISPRQDDENRESLPPTVIQSSPVVANGKMKTVFKKSKDIFVVTMVHGDMLLFIGDDFEVHIKRTGTTILLIGENVPLADSMEVDS